MKTRIAILSLLLITMLSNAVFAYNTDYTINGNDKVSIPDAYTYEYSINRISGSDNTLNAYFNQPGDLFIDHNDILYIADTKNNRVVKMGKNGELLRIFDTAGGISFSEPQGVFVTESNEIYIADTGNSRIVRFSENGEFVKAYGKPESEYLADVEVYTPTRIAVSKKGGMYILMGQYIMDVDSSNRFRGYLGQTKIGYSFTDWLLRIVASEEQKKSIAKRLASSYINLMVDDSGLIYATSRDTAEGQIKVLNSVGTNIYRKAGSAAGEITFSKLINRFFTGNVINKPFRYGEKINNKDPHFSDICVDRNGIITVIEQNTGLMYQYDQTGNLLAVFGGMGNNQGEFTIPVSIAVDSEGLLYVLDSSIGNIQVFRPTAFITKVQQATTAYYNGDYSASEKFWKEVLELNEIYPLAHYGFACIEMKKENWKAAMDGFRYSNDRLEYSKAFSEYRYQWMQENFGLLVLLSVAVIVGLGVLILWISRKSLRVLESFEYDNTVKHGLKEGLWICIGMIYRPGRTIDSIKYGRGRLKPYAAIIILALVFIVRVFFIYNVHYPLQDIELSDVNLILEFLKNVVPVITWIAACYLISSQFSGESELLENFIASSYAMVPYVVITFSASLLSHVLDMQDKGFFAVLVNGVLIWTVWLLARCVKRLNDYDLGRTVGVCLISLLAVLLIWFVVLFSYSLIVRLIQFVQELIHEIRIAFI